MLPNSTVFREDMYILLVIVISLYFIEAVPLQPYEHPKIYNDVLDFIGHHDLRDLTSASKTRILTSDDTPEAVDLIQFLTQHHHIPCVIFFGNESIEHSQLLASVAYIFMCHESKLNFSRIIENLRRSRIYKVYTQTVVVLLTQDKNITKYDLSKEMRSIWQFGLTQFMLVYFTDRAHGLSYNPFSKTIINITDKHGVEMFPNYLGNMHKYRLRVSLFEEWPILKKNKRAYMDRDKWIGRDYLLLEILTRMMNASFRIIEPPTNTRYRGAMNDVLKRRTDFCFLRRFQRELYTGIEYLTMNELSTLDILLPNPRQLNKNQAFFLIFQDEIWICLIVSMSLLLVFLRFLVIQTEHIPKWSIQELFIDMWSTLMNLGNTHFSKYNDVLKTSTILWTCACLVLYTSFQCRLMDLMQFPQFEKGINSLKALEANGLVIHTSTNYTLLLGNRTVLENDYVLLNHSQLHESLMNNKTKVAIALPFAVIRGHINPFVFSNLQTPTHVLLPEPLTTSFAAYMFPWYSPYRQEFMKNLVLQAQYGFQEKIGGTLGTMSTKWTKQVGLRLSMHHVQPAFLVLYVGCAASVIIALCEVSFYSPGDRKHKTMKPRQNKRY